MLLGELEGIVGRSCRISPTVMSLVTGSALAAAPVVQPHQSITAREYR